MCLTFSRREMENERGEAGYSLQRREIVPEACRRCDKDGGTPGILGKEKENRGAEGQDELVKQRNTKWRNSPKQQPALTGPKFREQR